MRTFTFTDAKSNKFWNIDVQGKSFTVIYGKLGTAGQTQTKLFDSPEKAQAAAAKVIAEKTKKGYTETTPTTSSGAAGEAEAFERSIHANPHDTTTIAAYADWLTEYDNPRGGFMQVQLALENESLPKAERKQLQLREAELLQEHEKDWVGEWADLYTAPTSTEGRGQINHTGGKKYEFKRGLLTTANFGDLTVAAARAFVKAPQTRFVRELFIGYYAWEEEFEPGPDVPADADSDPAKYVMLRWPGLRQVRRFQYGWISDEVYGDFCKFQSHLSGDHIYDFVKQMPDIEELLIFAHVQDATKLVALPMPNLRVLQLYHAWDYPLDRFAKNPWVTNLTHLLCHPHALESGNEPYIRLPQLRAICRSEYLTKLTHLRLRLADFGDDGVREIIASGILKRLKVLDLRHGAVTDEGARLLAACPDLKNLERLDLSRNGLTDAGKAALLATKVPVELDFQHAEIGDQEAYGDTPRYLFEGDYE